MRKSKEHYYERMLWYKQRWDEDREYGSIDRMIKGFDWDERGSKK